MQLTLEPGDAAYYVALDEVPLKARWPIVQLAASDQIRFERAVESCPDGHRNGSSLRVPLVGLTAHVELLSSDERGEPSGPVDVEGRLSVVLPVDDEACLDQPAPRLVPFGASLQLLPSSVSLGAPEPGVDQGAARHIGYPELLGPDRILASSAIHLFVFDRGEDFVDTPARRWSASAIPNPRNLSGHWFIKSSAVDPTSARPEYARIVLSVERLLAEVDWSVVVELEWTPSGFTDPVVLGEFPELLEKVRFDPEGRFVAVGDSGLIFVGSARGAPAQRVDLTGATGDLRGLLVGFDPGEPHVIVGSSSTLLFGDFARPETFRLEVADGSFRTPRAFESRRAPEGGTEVYFNSDSSDLGVRRADGRREVLRLGLPEAASACSPAVDECGVRRSNARISGLVRSEGGTMLMLPIDCSVVLEYAPERRCTRALRFEGLEITPEQQGFLNHGVIGHGRLVITGARGLLAVAPWPDGDGS